jgi:hypothetical protein
MAAHQGLSSTFALQDSDHPHCVLSRLTLLRPACQSDDMPKLENPTYCLADADVGGSGGIGGRGRLISGSGLQANPAPT